MAYQQKQAALQVTSLKELLRHENDIVRKIGAKANGAHLLLLDPERLLRDIGIEMTQEAIQETQEAYPDFLVGTGGKGAYDRVASSSGAGEVQITIHGLFQKEKA